MAKKPTQAQIAEALGISERMVRKHVRNGMPTGSLEAALAWYRGNVRQKEPGDLNEETRRLRAAQADLAELEAAEKRGELVPFDDVQVAWQEALVMFAGLLDGLPGRVALQLAGMTDAGEIRQLLLNETRQIRAAIAARLKDWGDAVQRGDGIDPAAGEDSGSVGGPDSDTPAG